jgi:hypothetical protein
VRSALGILSTAAPAGTFDLSLAILARLSARTLEISLLSPLSAQKITYLGTRLLPRPTNPKIHRTHGSAVLAVVSSYLLYYPDSFSCTGSGSVHISVPIVSSFVVSL